MKVIILFTFFLFCHGEYPVALQETTEPAPIDVYGPPTEYSAPDKAEEIKVDTEPNPAAENINAPALPALPLHSASFNFLSDLIAPPLVTLGLQDVKNQNQEPVKVTLAQDFPVNIPGLVPPINNVPLPPLNPPVQVLPPNVAPIPVPVPVPISVQAFPFPVQPIPVQSLPVQTKVNTAAVPQITELTTQPNPAFLQSLQTTSVPRSNYPQYHQSPFPFNYAPLFYRTNLLTPQSTFFNQFFPQVSTNVDITPQVPNLSAEPTSSVFTSSSENTISTANSAQFPAILEQSSAFEAQKTGSK